MLHTEFHRAKEKISKQLMVVLHGLGDSCAGYRWLPSLLGLPWMNYLLVDAPDSYYGVRAAELLVLDAAPSSEATRPEAKW